MRVFDIEKTCVADEFTQFNRPIKSVAYSPCGSLLVTVCEDGSIALHNAQRQHLPTKMMHLEFPPQHVHVAFGPAMRLSHSEDDHFMASFFGVVGEHGNCLMIYDSQSVALRNQISCGNTILSFSFTNNGREVVIVFKDQRMRFYSLARFEGTYLRELTACHRDNINATAISKNGGYLLTSGDDKLVKVWDYEAQKNVPFFQQSFIGHTYPCDSLMINPLD